MEIWHRIGFSYLDGVDAIIESLNIRYKKAPLPGGAYGIYFDIKESDASWPEISELIRSKNAVNMYDTIFSNQEILAAEWARLQPVFEQGFPQPEDGWEQLTYENQCPKCCTGFRQKAPLRLLKEPSMGKNDFLSPYWTCVLLCTSKVIKAIQHHKIKGYEVWPAIIHRTNEPSKIVSQLMIPHIAEPALADEDKLELRVCPQCGVTTYYYHKRGYMHLKRESLLPDMDFQLSFEWFGGEGFREILVSKQVAKLILDEKWRGVRLKPVELI